MIKLMQKQVMFCVLSNLVGNAVLTNSPKSELPQEQFPDDFYSIVPLNAFTSKSESLLNYITGKVTFADEDCDRLFENCLHNVDNNEEPIKYFKYEKPLSPKCSELLKAKYCLQTVKYTPFVCIYKRISEKVPTYEENINKTFVACLHHCPYEKSYTFIWWIAFAACAILIVGACLIKNKIKKKTTCMVQESNNQETLHQPPNEQAGSLLKGATSSE